MLEGYPQANPVGPGADGPGQDTQWPLETDPGLIDANGM